MIRYVKDNEADVISPCWVTEDGPFYAPLEYMCAMHKTRVKGAWIYDVAKRMIARGATLTDTNTRSWSPSMTPYAMRICEDANLPSVMA